MDIVLRTIDALLLSNPWVKAVANMLPVQMVSTQQILAQESERTMRHCLDCVSVILPLVLDDQVNTDSLSDVLIEQVAMLRAVIAEEHAKARGDESKAAVTGAKRRSKALVLR